MHIPDADEPGPFRVRNRRPYVDATQPSDLDAGYRAAAGPDRNSALLPVHGIKREFTETEVARFRML